MLDFYKGKRVLITGHTGFKGSWLSKIMIMAGADVYGYSLAPSEGKENLYEISGIANEMDSHIGDITPKDPIKVEKRFPNNPPIGLLLPPELF